MEVVGAIMVCTLISETGTADVKVVLFPELIEQFSECGHVLCSHLKGSRGSGSGEDIIGRHVVGHVDGELDLSAKR